MASQRIRHRRRLPSKKTHDSDDAFDASTMPAIDDSEQQSMTLWASAIFADANLSNCLVTLAFWMISLEKCEKKKWQFYGRKFHLSFFRVDNFNIFHNEFSLGRTTIISIYLNLMGSWVMHTFLNFFVILFKYWKTWVHLWTGSIGRRTDVRTLHCTQVQIDELI